MGDTDQEQVQASPYASAAIDGGHHNSTTRRLRPQPSTMRVRMNEAENVHGVWADIPSMDNHSNLLREKIPSANRLSVYSAGHEDLGLGICGGPRYNAPHFYHSYRKHGISSPAPQPERRARRRPLTTVRVLLHSSQLRFPPEVLPTLTEREAGSPVPCLANSAVFAFPT